MILCLFACSIYTATAPLVGIIMGSDSDLPVMKDAAEILESFGVSFEVCTGAELALRFNVISQFI